MVIIAKQNKERLIQYHTPHIFCSGYMALDIPGLNIKLNGTERKEGIVLLNDALTFNLWL